MGGQGKDEIGIALASLDVTDASSLAKWLHQLRGGLVATHGYLQLALANKYGALTPELRNCLDKAKAGLDEQVQMIGLAQNAARSVVGGK